ncbi:MAG: C39 family peptidase [Minisyncoccia bacterium]
MRGFKTFMERPLAPDDVKVRLPKVRQQTNYSCGAAAFRAVCDYFCVGPDTEEDFIDALHSTSEDGTLPENIVKAARKWGLAVVLQNHMPLRELLHHLDAGRPVICAMQAWGDRDDYEKDYEDGHYVVAVGYDDNHVYFEDPAMDGRARGYLKIREFLQRWHDEDANGHIFHHLGIIFDKKDKDSSSHIRKAKKIQ